LRARNAQWLFQGGFGLFEPVEADLSYPYETVKFRPPPPDSHFLPHLHPLPHHLNNRSVLALACESLG
jgi:hypothetical protein